MTDTLQDTEKAPPPYDEMSPRAGLIRLLVAVAAVVAITLITGTFSTAAVIVALLVMIMLHEFGHFVTAKAAGMKVTEFFVGFGPRLWAVRKGETEYGVKALPLGGYVRILGMHNLDKVDPEDEPRTYRQKPYWRRMSVALAGSTMHFLIALVLLWVVYSFVGVIESSTTVGSISKLTTGESPAQEAGFRQGDHIVAVDGKQVKSFDQLRNYITARPEQQIRFIVERHGRDVQLTVKPVDLSKVHVVGDAAPATRTPTGFVGIGSLPVTKTAANPLYAVGRAGSELGRTITISGKALASVFSPSGARDYANQLTEKSGQVQGTAADNRFISPIGAGRLASQAAHAGIREVLFLLILINVFVGIFNLVPLLPLDGGHVAIATYERIRSRRGREPYHADVAKLLPLTYGVVILLVAIGVTSLWLDIARPLANPFQ